QAQSNWGSVPAIWLSVSRPDIRKLTETKYNTLVFKYNMQKFFLTTKFAKRREKIFKVICIARNRQYICFYASLENE
ncbi:MAG: hypothetical protein PHY82_05500, partial [Lentisphaeria bacterium]|nr:hypothetical protein [Lentisphaeria bacterium]